MSSNTPLPAATFRKLEDELIAALRADGMSMIGGTKQWVARTRAALVELIAARSGSDMTAEERVILNLHRAYESGDPVALQAAFMEFNERARALAEAQKGKARDE